MRTIHRGIAVLALVLVAGAIPWAKAQNPGSAAPPASQENPPPDPETVSVQIVNHISQVDRGNLKGYWTAVEQRTKERWLQSLPRQGKDAASGEVKVTAWVHTDGRVTGLAMEQPSGNAALDRTARAAITGSVPYDPFPYGISVNQVRVRFTFTSNAGGDAAGNSSNPTNGKSPGLAGVKPRPHQ
ncbi:MAG TPA: TonB family protein [Acidobacteriaceae bacterium]|jgi:TonB family protein|nr:TonB family protein [Acidobacteriaceae bacterium]